MVSGHVDAQVADLAQVRAQVLLAETLGLLAAAPAVRDPRLTALLAHDAEHGGQLATSVLAWLDAFGDVREAAAALHIHPNTLRYRVRRAEQLTSLDLSRPEERLLAMLQLRLPPET
jgi:DNA-binding PucR family transcriptional regulator